MEELFQTVDVCDIFDFIEAALYLCRIAGKPKACL